MMNVNTSNNSAILPGERVLVTGATGYIGGRLVPLLLDAGYRVRCLARDPARLAGRWPGVELAAGDALDEASLRPALHDVRAAYYLIHSMAAGEEGFAGRDRLAAANFGRAAREMNVSRLIYLGGLGDERDQLSKHLRSRQETGRHLAAAGVPVTEFRAGVIVGSGSLSFELIRYLTERLPVMICPRWVRTRTQPIGVTDVLRYLADCLRVPESAGRVIEIGGRDVLTYGEMILGYARVRGLKRRLIDVPVLTPRLSSYWINLVTPIPGAIARPLIEGLRNEVVCRDASARALFEFAPAGYEEAVRLALQRRESGRVETVWSGAAAAFGTGARAARLTDTEGLIRERRRQPTPASPPSVFAVISQLGGDRGWLCADSLWRLRGLLDRLLGGVGMRRGRRSPTALRVGDAVDFWRVEAVEPERLLRLRAEMKLPGRAWLQFEIEPAAAGGSGITQTAFFEPRGLAGFLYWYLLYPAHMIIFRGLIRAIARAAERRDFL